jgi:hypothetical protein
VTTKAGFQAAIQLTGLIILEDRVATLCYNDGNLFGGHAIVLDVNSEGRFVDKPNLWG